MNKNETTEAAPLHDGKRTKLRSRIHAGEMGAVASGSRVGDGSRNLFCSDASQSGSNYANDRY